MNFTRRVLYKFWPFFLAISIEVGAIFVSYFVRNSFDSSNLAMQDCSAIPNQLPTATVVITGIVIAIVATVRLAKRKRWPYIFFLIFLFLIVIAIGLAAEAQLNLLEGWCF
jgi:cell division protein FtsW (lipid II flippase)